MNRRRCLGFVFFTTVLVLVLPLLRMLKYSTNYIIGQQFYRLDSNRNFSSCFFSNKRDHEFFMTVSVKGRLGNQMFEVASLLGISRRHGYIPSIASSHTIRKVFEIEIMNINIQNASLVKEKKYATYDSKFETLSHDRNWSLSGYLQSWKYFNHCLDDIRHVFQFKEKIALAARNIVVNINKGKRLLVGVHVRRSDMTQPSLHKIGFNVASLEYIYKAITYFKSILFDPLFVVLSDDKNWCKQHIKGPNIVYVGTGRADIDLAILSCCNHTIITTGTFGWWGAFLSDGLTVYYSRYPIPGTFLDTQYNPADHFLPEWIAMK